MEFYADWHTHSKYSDGRGTIAENVVAAIDKGLEELAITDHGPSNIGVGVETPGTYLKIKEEIRALNEKFPEIKVKTGAEADIVGLDGAIDIPHEIARSLDILIVGMHPYVVPSEMEGAWSIVGVNQLAKLSGDARDKARVNNTKALKEVVSNYDVDFISHPDLQMPVDISELAAFCAAHDTALEINTGHNYDKEELVRTALKEGVNFVVNSDAHYPSTVGNLSSGGELLEKFKVPVERVLNARKHTN
ncbi:MAG TPA: PHP domain-containing protein [Desulfobacteria bacterium]|nr:PHP domain-containing protein [Desulfobacteria bacterium]